MSVTARVVKKTVCRDIIHGWYGEQEYVVIEERGKRWCVTPYEGGLLIVDPEYVEPTEPVGEAADGR